MDYLESAFGEFSAGDVDAAVRFALDAILAAERFDRLGELITEFADLGEMGGEPGWVLERRDVGEAGNMPGYARWPAWARFRAFVDPTGFQLGHPEFYMDKPTFERYLSAAMRAYVELNPEKADSLPAALRKVIPV
jgi:hypothetical protein